MEYARAKSPEAQLLDANSPNQEDFDDQQVQEQDLASSQGSRSVRFTAPSLQPPQPPTPNFINPETPMRGSPMSALSPEAREVEHMMSEMVSRKRYHGPQSTILTRRFAPRLFFFTPQGPAAPFASTANTDNQSPMSQNSYPTYASLGNNNLPRLMHDLRKRVASEGEQKSGTLWTILLSAIRNSNSQLATLSVPCRRGALQRHGQ